MSVSLNDDTLPIIYDGGELRSSEVGTITPQPFGTDLYPAENGDILLDSEGNNGIAGQCARSSPFLYQVVNNDGRIGQFRIN